VLKKLKFRGFKKHKVKRSGFEDLVAANLKALGVPFDYEEKKISYVKEHSYIVDFDLKNGIIIESKGWFMPKDRKKHLDIKKQHPDLDIRFIFQRDNKLNRKTETRYSDWCKKHGFKYVVSLKGEVPKDWIKGKAKYDKKMVRRISK
jgi:hypothetical protein